MNLLQLSKKYKNGERTLREWLGSGGETVPKELADARAAVCLACPLNESGAALPSIVSDAVRGLLELKNKLDLASSGEEGLFTCSACLCPLKTKVWVPIERITPEENERKNYDRNCWILKESLCNC